MAFDKPQSRNEAILQNMLGANNELEPPKSRIEKLLIELLEKIGSIENVVRYIGVTTTEISDGSTTNPITINGASVTAVNGDMVYYSGSAYTWNGSAWQETVSFAEIITRIEAMEGEIGDLTDLETTVKNTIVAAINEVVGSVSNILDGTDIDSFGDVETALGTIQDGQSIDSFADVETALASKQDILTFDDTPTDNSNNPVKSNGIYDALALKQNATDNNLETTAKTVVGAINEHEGDVVSLKSGLTNLDNEVNGDATVYPYADVITIEDAVPSNLAECSVKIEPVQDLHGYDHPWVAGAGIQKLHLDIDTIKSLNTSGTWTGNSYEHNGITYECSVDSYGSILSIKSSGTNNTGNESILMLNDLGTQTFKAGTYTFGIPSSNYSGAVRYRANDGSWFAIKNTEVSKTYENDFTCIIQIAIAAGETVTNLMWYPIFCLSSAYDGNFYPYSNICPITGHTEASVQRDGKNLLDESKLSSLTTGTIEYKSHLYVGEGSFTLSTTAPRNSGGNANLFLLAGNVTSGADTNTNGVWNEQSRTVESVDGYVTIASRASLGVDVRDYDSMLELGQTATPYEPYAGKTYTIALGDTIYGGTVRIDSNGNTVMDVDRAERVFDGSVDEEWAGNASWASSCFSLSNALPSAVSIPNYATIADIICNSAEIKTPAGLADKNTLTYGVGQGDGLRLFVNVSADIDTSTKLKTYLSENPLQVVYPLATHTTVQLTPQQIQLLKGVNTITASTGDISIVVNGVSGSIGAVQEQVNELAEDVAEIKLLNYSTTEQKTGQKWIDGKDIYIKTFAASGGAYTSPISIAHGISNIDTVVEKSGSLYYGSTYHAISIDHAEPGNSVAHSIINADNIVLNYGSDYSGVNAISKYDVTLYYTKTT